MNKRESTRKNTKLPVCPRCNERSLFYNDREKVYECLNRKCRARVKSLAGRESDKVTRVDTITRQVEAPKTFLVERKENPIKSLGPFNISLKPKVSRLSSWWRRYRLRNFKITKRGVSVSWGLFKKTLISLALLAVSLLVISSVASVVSGKVAVAAGLVFGVVGVALGVWCSNSLSFRRVSFPRFFMSAVIVIIFVMVCTAYLDIRSLGDMRESIVNALSIPKLE